MSWQIFALEEISRFILIAVRMLRVALLGILFVLLEGAILKVVELVIVLPRSQQVQLRIEALVDEITFWSTIGVVVFYVVYVIGEFSQRFLRTMRGE